MEHAFGRGGARSLAWAVRAMALSVLVAVHPGMTRAAEVVPRLITMATGSKTGIYYFAGGGICALVNANRWTHGLRCVAESSNGSIENLRSVRLGSANFAIAQSDWQYHAVHGTDAFATRGPDYSLRSVMALYPEPFTVIANAASGITRFSDLKGRRISIGPTGSGSRATMEVVMGELGWTAGDFAYLGDLSSGELTEAICNGDVDAAVMVIANPNLAVEEIMASCDAVLVPLERDLIEALTSEHPYYFDYTIPGGTYRGQSVGVDVFALSATLVTSSKTPPKTVHEVVSAILGARSRFEARHPSFGEFELSRLAHEGLTAPLHVAARMVFEREGLLVEEADP